MIKKSLENRSSKQFTELENIENWASYGQKLIFSLKKFHFSTKTKKVYFDLTAVKFQYFSIL